MNRIEEIRAREQAATPGEWRTPPTFSGICSQSGDILAVNRIVNTRDADMIFISFARQDIPYLLSEVDRLTAELEEYRKREAELKQWLTSKIEMLDKRIKVRSGANCFDESSAISRFNSIAGAYESVLEYIEQPES